MSWVESYKPKNQKLKDFFNYIYSDKLIDIHSSIYRSYAAIEIGNKIEGFVILHKIRNETIYYKLISENDLPYEFNCPKKILEILSPTDNSNALEWRIRCWHNIHSKETIKEKNKIELNEVIKFKEEIEIGEFKLRIFKRIDNRKLLFEGYDDNKNYIGHFLLTKRYLLLEYDMISL